jgi:hypothetical protein
MSAERADVTLLSIGGSVFPLVHGSLMRVRTETRDDWELIAQGTHAFPIDPGGYELEIVVLAIDADAPTEIRQNRLIGEGVMVRIVDSTIVFRGNGPLRPVS